MFDAIFPKHWTTLQRLMWLKTNALARAVYETITGNPVSFTAKAAPLRKLEVAFSPVQSLNGYDSPWPAGGGANKWDEELEVGGIDDSTGEPAIVPSQRRSINFIPVSPETSYYACTPNVGSGGFWVYCYDESKAFIGRSTAGGGGYDVKNTTFTTAANCHYIKFKTQSSTANYNNIAINYPATVTTYSPYSNECPISGWSSLTVEQRGKNLFDKSAAVVGKWLNVNTGAEENTTNLYSLSDYIPVKAGQTYTMGQPNSARRWLYDSNKTPLAKVDSLIFTPSADGYVRITIGTNVTDINTFMVVMGNALPAEYVPYNPLSRSISISLGQTVYSGTVDVVTGVLTDETVQSATLDGTGWSTGAISGKTVFQHSRPSTIASAANFISNYVTKVSSIGASTPANSAYLGSSYINVYCPDLTLEQWTALLNTAPIQFVRINTPKSSWKEYQLTPQEVESLAGDNTMWTDADSLTVEYRSN